MPNPAAESVTITSSFGLTSITSEECLSIASLRDSRLATIDLRGWAVGQYIMMVHTPQGVTAKRLTVVR